MKRSILILCTFMLMNLKLWGQESINNYKYVIIPTKYSMFDSDDKYQLNSLTKFLFNKYGYTAFLKSDSFPEELNTNPCLGLNLEVEKHSGFLKTKLQIHLYDCKQKLVMSSKIGSSRVKEYNKAYNLALRDAFTTFQNFKYEFKEVETDDARLAARQKDDEIKSSRTFKIVDEKSKSKSETELNEDIKKINETIDKSIETSNSDKKIGSYKKENTEGALLYAQPITNGFQLVDTTPKKVMVLLNTGVENTFIVKGKDAIVCKKGKDWVFIKNDGNTIESKVLNIKF